jgi:hypothetical protein
MVLGGLLLLGVVPRPARADELPKEYRDTVAKGLKFLVSQQAKDGHWEAFGGQYPVSMTGLCGLALLMEGSNLREGKYRDNLRRAVNWLLNHSGANGQIGSADLPGEAGRYMFGHGYALLFLACAYGEEGDRDRRQTLEAALTRAVKFSRAAQTSRGGWGDLSAKDGADFDEGSMTTIQLQALYAARDAGIVVPDATFKDAMRYLRDATDPTGGVLYSVGGGCGGARPPVTAAAVLCGIGAGDYDSKRLKGWLKFTHANMQPIGDRRQGVDEYTHYYFAQVAYTLGENGWAKLFPDSKPDDRLTWGKYRKASFDYLVRAKRRRQLAGAEYRHTLCHGRLLHDHATR